MGNLITQPAKQLSPNIADSVPQGPEDEDAAISYTIPAIAAKRLHEWKFSISEDSGTSPPFSLGAGNDAPAHYDQWFVCLCYNYRYRRDIMCKPKYKETLNLLFYAGSCTLNRGPITSLMCFYSGTVQRILSLALA